MVFVPFFLSLCYNKAILNAPDFRVQIYGGIY